MAVKKKIALLMGGRSNEREVSLSSGKEVLANLDPSKYEVEVFDPASDLLRLVEKHASFDLAFPVLHGRYGEDGTIQGLLELLGLPYVGSGVLASAMAMDKKQAKDIFAAKGLVVPPEIIGLKGQDAEELVTRARREFGFPLVIKPVTSGSSVGLIIAKEFDQAVEAIREVWEFEPRALIERRIVGRELTVGVLGNNQCRALPPIEIIPAAGHEFFDYQAKYVPGQAKEICPAKITEKELADIQNQAIAAHKACGCRGISRSDFILVPRGIFYILEINTLPGMTQNSLVPRAAAAIGWRFSELLDELIRLVFDDTDQ